MKNLSKIIIIFCFPILAGFIVCFSVFTARCQNFSEWRGIGRTGVYNEKGLMQKWSPNGPEMLWHIDSLPKGFSSVSVANNTLYITGTKDSTEYLIAADMKGKIKWETPYGRVWGNSYSESRCTPTVENDRVYVTSGNGDVACIDAKTGKIIWKVQAMEKFGGTYGKWGIAESPLVTDNKVFFTTGGEITTMVALDKKTGETIWQSESLKDNPAYVSPILVEKGGKKLIVTVTEKNIIGVSANDGKILWDFDFGKYAGSPRFMNIHTNTPLYYTGGIYVTTAYNHTCVMLKLSDDASSVSLAWTDTVLGVHHGGVVRIGDYIYGSNWINNTMGKWVCLDWNTGKAKYVTDWINKGSIIADKDMLYCYEEKDGNFGLVKANPDKFEVISSFKVSLGSGPHWAHPVIHDGVLYIRHGDVLMAYNIRNKE